MILSQDNVMVRVCRYFALTMEKTPSGMVSRPQLSKSELANFMGIHRTTLYKILRELEAKQILSPYKKDCVFILNEKAFQSLLNL